MHIALSSRSDVAGLCSRALHHVLPARHLPRHLRPTESFVRTRYEAGLGTLPANAQSDISEVLSREGEIRNRLLLLRDKRMSGNRIRQHGDYQLNNVLYSGSDWIITNFEGDPYSPVERAAHQAFRAAGCRHHAALVSLCFPRRVVWRRSRHCSQPRSSAAIRKVGKDLVSMGQHHFPGRTT